MDRNIRPTILQHFSFFGLFSFSGLYTTYLSNIVIYLSKTTRITPVFYKRKLALCFRITRYSQVFCLRSWRSWFIFEGLMKWPAFNDLGECIAPSSHLPELLIGYFSGKRLLKGLIQFSSNKYQTFEIKKRKYGALFY